MNEGILEIDLHGMNQYKAKVLIDSRLKSTKAYRIRLIHGHHGGTQLRDMIESEYAVDPRVLRIERGPDPGRTELVLREY
jgi:hypothetical protein